MAETNAWIRLHEARPLIEWIIKAAIEECGLTVHVLPAELISNRVALTHFLAEQLHNLGNRKADELEKCWETQRHILAAAVSVSDRKQTPVPATLLSGAPKSAQ
jgi:hypothetical protein